jgi:hypothetical protein
MYLYRATGTVQPYGLMLAFASRVLRRECDPTGIVGMAVSNQSGRPARARSTAMILRLRFILEIPPAKRYI